MTDEEADEAAHSAEVIYQMGEEIVALKREIVALKSEIDWLTYFYDAVDSALGCASDDVYHMIKRDYVVEGNVLPEGYDE